MATTTPLSPSPRLLAKLGSIVVHAKEYLSSDGHEFDRAAIVALLDDSEVREWLSAMKVLGMLPVERKSRR